MGPLRAEAPEASAEDKESARVLFGIGLGLLEKGEARLALEKFELADKLYSTPITSLQVGKTHLALSELVAAHAAFIKVATIPVRTSESEKSAAARDEAAKLALEVRPRLAELRVALIGLGDDRLSAMTLDARPVASPQFYAPQLLDPGVHHVLVRVSGVDAQGGARVRELSATVSLKEGEKHMVSIEVPPTGDEPVIEDDADFDKPPPHLLIVPRVALLLTGIARSTTTCEGSGCASQENDIDRSDQSGVSLALDALRPIGRNFRLGLSVLWVPKLQLQASTSGHDWTFAPVAEGLLPLSKGLGAFGRAQVGAMVFDCCDAGRHLTLVYGFGGGLVVALTAAVSLRAEFLYQRTVPFTLRQYSDAARSNSNFTDKLTSDRLWTLLGIEWGF